MSRRRLLVLAAVLLVGAVGAYLAKPIVGSYVWKWRSGLQELPLGGVTLSYRDFGQGAPVVVIVSGMAVHKDSYYPLQRSLSRVTRVISYDRPGIGDSSSNSEPRTLDYIDRDMRAFLQALHVPPPYILIGHSLGGHIIRYYANRHPGEVAGLVFLDAPPEDWFRYIRNTWPKEEVATYFKWWSGENPAFSGVSQQEMLAYETNCDMIRGIGVAPDMPVLMFTGNNTGHFRKDPAGQEADRRNWAAMQASLLVGVKDARQLVDWSVGHMMYRDKPEWVEGEIGAFIRKLRAAREQPARQLSLRSPAPAPATMAVAGAAP